MRFSFLNFEFVYKLKFIFSLFGIMFWGRGKDGNPTESMSRYLLYVSKDPIGWKFQFFYRSFHKGYLARYAAVMERINHPHGRPVQTKGVKGAKVTPLGQPK